MMASMSDCGVMLTTEAIRRQLAAMPNDLYLIRLIHSWTHRPFPGERLWTTAQLLHAPTIGFLRVRNCEGWDVYMPCNPRPPVVSAKGLGFFRGRSSHV